MEGGLHVAQQVATIPAHRRHMKRSHAGYIFSAWAGEDKLQEWTLSSKRCQEYNTNSATCCTLNVDKAKNVSVGDVTATSKPTSKKRCIRALTSEPLTLRNSYISVFDGHYRYIDEVR